MIELLICNTSPLYDEVLFKKAYNAIPPARKRLADGIRHQPVRVLSVGAAYLLAYALKERGIDASRAEISVGEFGKPYLPEYPDIHFSLAHSGSFAVCSVSDVPVGCDMEMKKKADIKIAERFFTPGEAEYVSTEKNPDEAFLRLWTLKESYVKLLGKGISACPLDSFEIRSDPLPSVVGHDEYVFSEFCFGDCRISVCSTESVSGEIRELKLENGSAL